MLSGAVGAAVLAWIVPQVGYVFLPGALMTVLVLVGRPTAAGVAAVLTGLMVTPLAYALFPALMVVRMPLLTVIAAVLVSAVAAACSPPRKAGGTSAITRRG